MTDSTANALPLTIRGRRAADWSALLALCQLQPPHLNPLEIPYLSDDHAQAELSVTPDNLNVFALVAEWENQLVGEITLHRMNQERRRHIAGIDRFVVVPDSRGRSVGLQLLAAMIDLTEHWLHLTRLEHYIRVDNMLLVEVYQAAGFQIEGTLRDYAYRDGAYVDAYLIARVQTE